MLPDDPPCPLKVSFRYFHAFSTPSFSAISLIVLICSSDVSLKNSLASKIFICLLDFILNENIFLICVQMLFKIVFTSFVKLESFFLESFLMFVFSSITVITPLICGKRWSWYLHSPALFGLNGQDSPGRIGFFGSNSEYSSCVG